MSKRTHSLNAYEVALTSSVGDSSLTFPVDTVIGLTAPLYLVIDPDDPSKREYFKATSINGNILDVGSLSNRGLLGTSGGLPQSHDSGARVRAVSVHQWIDDIFDDIELLEEWNGAHIADVNPHSAAEYLRQSDADARYVSLTGDTMQGDLNLNFQNLYNVPDPEFPGDVASKSYVDSQGGPSGGSPDTVVFSQDGNAVPDLFTFAPTYQGRYVSVRLASNQAISVDRLMVEVIIGANLYEATIEVGQTIGAITTIDEPIDLNERIRIAVQEPSGSDISISLLLEPS